MPPGIATNRIETYWDELAAFLTRRLGDPVVAADITQEAYLRAAALPANTALINPRAWLFATARNLLVDHARRSHVRRAVNGTAEYFAELSDQCPGADAILLSREELAMLARAIEALPPRTREVFRLHKFDGRSYAEISAQLDIAKNTVMVHMVKALGHCRKAMQDHRSDAADEGSEAAANGSARLARLPMHEV